MNGLVDRFGRTHEYLRISVTDRCNLRCRYCMPAEETELASKRDILSFDEIVELAALFAELGIRKIRITGGEPLVRRGIECLCEQLAAVRGIQSLGITTNGVLLSEKALALKQAGVREVNISLDTLQPERFLGIALRDEYDAVRAGIRAALENGFQSVKINTVVMKGVNDDELLDLVDFAALHSLNVRFIEYMPFPGNRWSQAQCLPCDAMKERIESKYKLAPLESRDALHGPAVDFRVEGTDAVVGFIATMSDSSCASCNRLRLTADGRLRSCLFSTFECDLKTLLRSGADGDLLQHAIAASTFLKWKGRPPIEELLNVQTRSMTAIGG